MSQPSPGPAADAPGTPYVRAIDPLPLESPEQNKLHAFYTHLAEGRLTTTRCRQCGRLDWPPRAFCPACTSDAFEWADLPLEGRLHGYTVQETGIPAGFPRPLVFAMVAVGGLRVLAPLVGPVDPDRLAVGAPVRFRRVRVTDGPGNEPRYLPAFALADAGPDRPGSAAAGTGQPAPLDGPPVGGRRPDGERPGAPRRDG
jgi:uncharacterized OB-fold protein